MVKNLINCFKNRQFHVFHHGYLKACLRNYLVTLRDRGMYPLGRRFRQAAYGSVKRVNELFIRGYVLSLEWEVSSRESRSNHIPISSLTVRGAWDMARRMFNLHDRKRMISYYLLQ